MTAFLPFRLFTQPVDSSRSDGLDALRFFLALWVMFAHVVGWSVYLKAMNPGNPLERVHEGLIWLFQRNGETHPAVLAFIVLSGYCIHRNGFRLQSNFSLKSFGIRRFFRILPLYLLASALGIALYLANMETNGIAAKALSGTDNITLMYITVKLIGISSFIPSLHACSFQGNAPLTTAMVEIWLYILYGAITWFIANGIAPKWLVIGATVLWVSSFGYMLLKPSYVGWWHNGSFISFALYWWLGALFAAYRPTVNGKRQTTRVIMSGLALILLGSFGSSLVLIELRKIGLVLLFALLISRLDCGWRCHALAKAGQSGYDIYALHAPLLIFLFLNGAGLILAVCFTLIISSVCHLAFERPLLEYGKRLAKSVANK